jgi:hypothetical protein
MISRIEVWHRGQAIPLRLFETSDTNSPLFASIRHGSIGFLYGRKFPIILPAMPIRHHLQGHRFDAETVRLLGIAYEMTLVALHQRRANDPLRAAAAQKIIELAKAGERNPERLCDGALKATQLMAPVLISDPSPLPPHASPPVLPDS